MGKLKWGGGEKGGWGERKGASVHDHVGDGTWTITLLYAGCGGDGGGGGGGGGVLD